MLIEVHLIIVDYVSAYNILIEFTKKASCDYSHEASLSILIFASL
ncbi:hypothetical protein OKW24_003309 [Peribacillus simplex]|nr:hypothetical protein [Peribacillus simplex]